MKTLLKIGALMTGMVTMSFAQNSVNLANISSLKLINASSFQTIPIPPADPDSPKVPLSFRTIPIPPADPDSPKVPLG